MAQGLSYKDSGVDIGTADAAKRSMAASLATDDERVLNSLGAFASLIDGRFPGYDHPILVLKTEEPGSKQKLALQHGRVESIGYDLIHHLIDDIVVMGARPVAVQDAIICGKLDSDVVTRLVSALAEACRLQGCSLVGGETSEQPGVIDPGIYILTASIVGVVEKSKIVDGSKTVAGDVVLGVASNGIHTNGYSLIRALMAQDPEVADLRVGDETCLDAVLRPHHCYLHNVEPILDHPGLHGMAHITGGGIEGNLNRVLPPGLDAVIERRTIRTPDLFRIIQERGDVSTDDMFRTFNMGVGLAIVVDRSAAAEIVAAIEATGVETYLIGSVAPGTGEVSYI